MRNISLVIHGKNDKILISSRVHVIIKNINYKGRNYNGKTNIHFNDTNVYIEDLRNTWKNSPRVKFVFD